MPKVHDGFVNERGFGGIIEFLDSYSSSIFVAAPEELGEEDKNDAIITETAGWMERAQ